MLTEAAGNRATNMAADVVSFVVAAGVVCDALEEPLAFLSSLCEPKKQHMLPLSIPFAFLLLFFLFENEDAT